MDILIVTHTHTHLRGHPADGGYIISCFDEVGGVLLQLKLTQPLVDGLRVLTTERGEIYEAALSHTHRNIHLGAHTHSFQLTLPSRSCSGLMKPFWGVPLTCRREPPRKHTQSIVEGDRLHLTLLWGTTGWANQTHQETHGTQSHWVQAKCKTMLKITQGCLDTVIICINLIHVPVNQVMLNQPPPCSCVFVSPQVSRVCHLPDLKTHRTHSWLIFLSVMTHYHRTLQNVPLLHFPHL